MTEAGFVLVGSPFTGPFAWSRVADVLRGRGLRVAVLGVDAPLEPPVVLVGHSAGATAVQLYGAQRQDDRVAGIVLASGRFRPGTAPVDSARLKEAARLVAEGRGEEVPQIPNAARPTVTSAATLLDLANMGVMLTDFYGVEAANPPVTRIRCPILAWFGTKGDVGTAADLELLTSTLKRHSGGPSQVTTALIQNADHMYGGEEAQVAQTLVKWVDDVVAKK